MAETSKIDLVGASRELLAEVLAILPGMMGKVHESRIEKLREAAAPVAHALRSMVSNFDPANCSPAEENQIRIGYADGFYAVGGPMVTSPAYDYGRANGEERRRFVIVREALAETLGRRPAIYRRCTDGVVRPVPMPMQQAAR